MKFARIPAIEKEDKILEILNDAGVQGVVHVYGQCYMSPFRGISMELHETNLACLVRSNGVMLLEQVAALGISLGCVLSAVHILFNSIISGSQFRYRHYETSTSWASSIVT